MTGFSWKQDAGRGGGNIQGISEDLRQDSSGIISSSVPPCFSGLQYIEGVQRNLREPPYDVLCSPGSFYFAYAAGVFKGIGLRHWPCFPRLT